MNAALSLHTAEAMSGRPADRKAKPSAAIVPPLLVGREEAAAALGLSVASWDRAVAAGRTPAPIRLGGRLLFRWQQLEEWTALNCPDRRTFEALTSSQKTPNGRGR